MNDGDQRRDSQNGGEAGDTPEFQSYLLQLTWEVGGLVIFPWKEIITVAMYLVTFLRELQITNE